MTKRLPIIDVYRGCSALIVTVAHVRGITFVPYGYLEPTSQTSLVFLFFSLTRFAKEAVIAFFLISGYLVGGKYLMQALRSEFDWKDYVAARLARIYAVLIPVLLVTSGFVAYNHQGSFPVEDLFVNIIGLQHWFPDENKYLNWGRSFGGNGPLWTLSYEIWFYVMVGAACTLYARRKQSLCTIQNASLPLALFLFSVFVLFFNKKLDYVAALVFGSALYFVELNARGATVCRWGGMVALIPSVMISQLSMDSMSITPIPFDERIATLLVFSSLGLILLGCKNSGWCFPKRYYMDAILWKPILGISTISYSLYLIHYVVLERLFGGAKYDFVSVYTVSVALGKLGVCLVSGWALYLLFERHTDRIKALLHNKPLKRVDSSGVMAVGSQP